MKQVSATEANRSFSKLLAQAVEGRTTEIMVRGEVVAEIRPAGKSVDVDKKAAEERWQKFLHRLNTQAPINVPRGTRDELYDDD